MNQPNVPSPSTPQDAAAPPYGAAPRSGAPDGRRKVTVRTIADMRQAGEKISMLTAYDATFAAAADAAGIDSILVGDSLGMVCQGKTSTVGVSLQDIAYHTQCVARGLDKANGHALLVADLPFGSYHQSTDQAMASAVRLMEAGAHMVKLEGGGWTTEIVRFLVERGVPVCGHLGLTPQTVSALGGYRVQGRDDDGAARLLRDAGELDQAGASMLVLEMIPARLAAELTRAMTSCATIGIGAGCGTDGQVLVMHDMLGLNLGKMPRFVRNFAQGADGIQGAFAAYVHDVKAGAFPVDAQHAW